MKIRQDFVTNSSSSSFIIINAKNKELARVASEYKEEFAKHYAHAEINGEDVQIHIEEPYTNLPENKKELIHFLISAITETSLYAYEYEELDEYANIILKKLGDKELAKSLFKDRKAIMEAMKHIEITKTTYGWEGDDDTRFDEESYDKKTLKKIYKEIAKEYDVDVEEIDEEMFSDYVADKSSVEEITYSYDKATGKEKTKREYRLEEL